MSIPDAVRHRLADDLWMRPGSKSAEEPMSKLGIDESSDFAEFFRTYRGPFVSRSMGYELLDLVEQDDSILSTTKIAHQELGLPDNFVILSNLIGNAVLVYDVKSGQVYDVDFEGGDEILKTGQLAPRWSTWNSFITAFFSG